MSQPRSKAEWRREFRRRCARIGPVEAERASARVAGHLAEVAEFHLAKRVVLYASLPDELPTASLSELAVAEKKVLLWPRIRGQDLEFAASAPSSLVPGAFGILEPGPDSAPVPLALGDLLILPGRGFDRRGLRLGRGKGYYDRVLVGAPELTRVGVGHDAQRVDRLPSEPHDAAMHVVITDRGVYRSR